MWIKMKQWWVRYKFLKMREAQAPKVNDMIAAQNRAHRKYLEFDRQGEKAKEDALYWRGRRDGIRDLWK